MYSSASRLVAAMVMTLAVTACGDGVRIATAPTPTPAARSTFAVFGMVSEVTPNGIVPVEGVGLTVASCDASAPGGCGKNGSLLTVTTNAQGGYIAEGVYPGPASVWAEKTGFQLPAGVTADGEGAQTVRVNGDTRFDIQLVRGQ